MRGLTDRQAQVLSYICSRLRTATRIPGGWQRPTPVEIARCLGDISRQRALQVVHDLERKGYVRTARLKKRSGVCETLVVLRRPDGAPCWLPNPFPPIVRDDEGQLYQWQEL